jgi:hypothetical protein
MRFIPGVKSCDELREKGWSDFSARLLWENREHPDIAFYFKDRGNGAIRVRPPALARPSISGALRKRVFERDAYRCQQCGDWHDLSVDHVVPVCRGGPTVFENLQTLCMTCNTAKGSK